MLWFLPSIFVFFNISCSINYGRLLQEVNICLLQPFTLRLCYFFPLPLSHKYVSVGYCWKREGTGTWKISLFFAHGQINCFISKTYVHTQDNTRKCWKGLPLLVSKQMIWILHGRERLLEWLVQESPGLISFIKTCPITNICRCCRYSSVIARHQCNSEHNYAAFSFFMSILVWKYISEVISTFSWNFSFSIFYWTMNCAK